MHSYYFSYKKDACKWVDVVKAETYRDAKIELNLRHQGITDIEIIDPSKARIDDFKNGKEYT